MTSSSAANEFDFGFGTLLDNAITGNFTTSASAAGSSTSNAGGFEASTSSATANGTQSDFLTLSSLFAAENASSTGTVDLNNLSAFGTASSSAAAAKKSLFDHYQQATQQASQQDQSSSLNALLSQQSVDNSNITANATSNSSANNNYNMFLASMMDNNSSSPAQEDTNTAAQQMFFLPGSNQVISMASNGRTTDLTTSAASSNSGISTHNPMMALANLPVVFPSSSTTGVGATSSSTTSQFALTDTTASLQDTLGNWSSTSSSQQQQGLLTFGGLEEMTSSALNPTPLGLSALTQLQQQQAAAANQTRTRFVMAPPSTQATLIPQVSATAMTQTAAPPKPAAAPAMPVRPLSAYNFFFSDERERILHNKTDENDTFDDAKKQHLLLQHLNKDRSKRRPHRKTHGKINFTTLSKLIGQRWKALPEERRNFYREVAAIDLERYQRELRERSPATTAAAASAGAPGISNGLLMTMG